MMGSMLAAGAGFGMILVAATIYGVGKTFLWPTMLGVVGERFPKGGALAMGAMGGIGMLSAGVLGGPGIGYTQDVNTVARLKQKTPPSTRRWPPRSRTAFYSSRRFTAWMVRPWPASIRRAEAYQEVRAAENFGKAKGAQDHGVDSRRDGRRLSDTADLLPRNRRIQTGRDRTGRGGTRNVAYADRSRGDLSGLASRSGLAASPS